MRYRSFLFAIVPLAIAAAPVRADQVTANFTGVGKGDQPFESNLTGGTGFWAAQLNWHQTGGNYNLIVGEDSTTHNFATYCIELTTELTGNPHTFDAITGAGLTDPNVLGGSALAVETLFGYAGSHQGSLDGYTDILTYGGGTLDNDHAAAFQAALWSLIYDPTSLDVTTGSFLQLSGSGLTSNVKTLANNLLGAVASNLYTPLLNLVALVNDTGDSITNPPDDQDQIVIGFALSQPVPLPGAAAAAVPILMLGGATLKSKRRRRQAEESAL